MAARPVEFVLRLLGVREATGELAGLAGAAEQAQGATGRAGDAGSVAGKKLKDLGERAGAGESSLLALAGVLDLVSPGLGDLARTTGDLAGATEGAVRGFQGGLIPALGAVAAAVGVAYLAWQAYAETGERAARIDAVLAANQERLQPLLEATADALVDLREARGEITEAEADSIRRRTDAYRGYSDAVGAAVDRLGELRQEESSFVSQMAQHLMEFSVGRSDSILEDLPSIRQGRALVGGLGLLLGGQTTSTDEAAQEREALTAGIAETAAATDALVGVGDALQDALGDAGAAKTAATLTERLDAVVERAAAARRELALLGAGATGLAQVQTGIDAVDARLGVRFGAGAGDEAGLASATAAAGQLEALAAAARTQAESMAAAQDVLSDWQRSLAAVAAAGDDLAAAMPDLAADLATGLAAVRQSSSGEAGFAAGAALVGGDLGGAITAGLGGIATGGGALSGAALAGLGMAAPVGLAASSLSALGDVGAEGMADSIEGGVEAILDGIVELPELLMLRLPEMVVHLVAAINRALLITLPKAILEAWVQIFQAIRELFTRSDEEKEAAEERRESRRAAIASAFSALGGRASGGLIAETGRYMLHQGELVVPASGVTSSSGASQLSRVLGGGGGGVTVVNHGLMTRSLAREVTRMIRQGQSGYGEDLSLDPVI